MTEFNDDWVIAEAKKQYPGYDYYILLRDQYGNREDIAMIRGIYIEGTINPYLVFTQFGEQAKEFQALKPLNRILTDSEIDDYVTARYEPFREDFEMMWQEIREEGLYHNFDNWWSDLLKMRCEELIKKKKNGKS